MGGKSGVHRRPRSARADQRYESRFVGVDGEGGNEDGVHRYLLLRAGQQAIENVDGLTVWECLGFLADMPKKGRTYVAFAFDYDVTMMLRQTGTKIWDKLMDRASRERIAEGKRTGRYWPVRVGEFEIDYMPRKEFKVRRRGARSYTVVHDTFTFFQSSFVAALQEWFPEEEWEAAIDKIAKGKKMRHDFGAVTEHEREYNKLEIIMLERLMNRFRDLCFGLDIRPRKWQGPGHLVNAVFEREGVPRKEELHVPREVWDAAQFAYVAGRFECSTYGDIRQEVYQYDINSAYASYYRSLPCVRHGRWRQISELPDAESGPVTYVVHVTFHHPAGRPWHTLPMRSPKGNILFPQTGQGWYWGNEVDVARANGVELTVHDGYVYECVCECEPFAWVYRLYDERDHYGKTSGRGMVLKIVLATIYGKLAQSIGNPIYANPVHAGLITSSCRARLIDATLRVEHGQGVLMLATDGLFSTALIPGLSVGLALGEWELTIHQSMFIVQSGVYFLDGRKPKTRGVPQSKVIEHEQDFRDAWQTWVEGGADVEDMASVKIMLRVFVGIRVARQWKKPALAGQWLDRPKRVTFDWTTKRIQPTVDGDRIVTLPVVGSPETMSLPPRRSVGGEYDELVTLLHDAPDWADQLLWDGDLE